jgi:hydroxymethylbilane synthase
MSVTPPLRLGTRGSDLALWQARHVATMIRDRMGREVTIDIIKTSGDRIQHVAFHKMEGKGFFTKELQLALIEERVDLVVHSMKDLPTDSPDGLAVAAIPERTTAADLILAGRGLLDVTHANPFGLPAGATVGTSSLRRAAQVLARCPDVEVTALRGNVPTRLEKLREGSYDAILLAAAGVTRLELDLDGLEFLELPFEAMLPAPAQGALAIEARDGSPEFEALGALHDPDLARCVTAERELLRRLEGGCHLPLGCFATLETDGAVQLRAVLGEVDEEVSQARVRRVGATAPSEITVAKLCHQALIECGAVSRP